LITVWAVVWLTVVVAPLLEILAPPAATTPPAGKAWAGAPNPSIRQADRALMAKDAARARLAVREDFLPAPETFSETATKVPVLSFQTEW
jgi:hypothetical protein